MIAAAAATGLAVRTDTARNAGSRNAGRAGPDRGCRLRLGAGSGSGASGGGINLTPILAVLLVAGGLFLVGRALLTAAREREGAGRGPRHAQPRGEPGAPRQPTRRSRTPPNDVEFAAAQWGDPEVVPYRDAIRTADGELRAAFALRQKLDDAYPEKPPERDAMLREIIARCTTAQQLLDAQEQRFDELRDLEASAPAQLAALPAAIEALRARCTAADQVATRLRGSYAPSATASIDGNLAEAGKALDAAAGEAARGAAVVGTRPSEGVVALRRAQEAMARATQLVEAVERLAKGLDDAAARLPARAGGGRPGRRRGPRGRGPPGTGARGATRGAGDCPARRTRPARCAQRRLPSARRDAPPRPDRSIPLAALQRAVAANQAADAIVAQVARCPRAGCPPPPGRRCGHRHGAGPRQPGDRLHHDPPSRRRGDGADPRRRRPRCGSRRPAGSRPRTPRARPRPPIAPSSSPTRPTGSPPAEFEGWNRGGGPVAGPYRPQRSRRRDHRRGRGRHPGRPDQRGRAGRRGARQRLGRQPVGRRRRRLARPAASACRAGGGGGRSRGGGFSMPSGGGGFGGGGGGGRVRGGRW